MPYESVKSFVTEVLQTFLNSRSFIYTVRNLVTQFVAGISDKRLEELVDPAELAKFFRKRLRPLINDGRAEEWVKSGVRDWLHRHMNENTSFENLIPDDFVSHGFDVFQSLLPELSEGLLQWLRREPTRKQLESKGRFLLRDVLDKLNSQPEWGIIMGTGQKLLAEHLVDGGTVSYQDLPHFPRATSPTHQGRLSWGRLAGRRRGSAGTDGRPVRNHSLRRFPWLTKSVLFTVT